MIKIIQATSIGALETAVNEFLEDAASCIGVTMYKEDGFYYAVVCYTASSGD